MKKRRHICDVCGQPIRNEESEFAGLYGFDEYECELCDRCGRIWYYYYFEPSGIIDKYKGEALREAWLDLFKKFLNENSVKVILT